MHSTTHGARRYPIDRRKTTDSIVGGIVLALVGAFLLLLSGGDPGMHGSGNPTAGGISEDWHGNVRRSYWTP